jgi:aromatic ring hydroxylase
VVDLAITVQTVRSCLIATERDPRFTATGYCVPNHSHLAVGGIAILQARQRLTEILRIVPGSSLRPRVGVRVACQWWHPGVARPAPPQLRAL